MSYNCGCCKASCDAPVKWSRILWCFLWCTCQVTKANLMLPVVHLSSDRSCFDISCFFAPVKWSWLYWCFCWVVFICQMIEPVFMLPMINLSSGLDTSAMLLPDCWGATFLLSFCSFNRVSLNWKTGKMVKHINMSNRNWPETCEVNVTDRQNICEFSVI